MGVSVISIPATVSAAASQASAPQAGIPLDFAALLGEQMTGLIIPNAALSSQAQANPEQSTDTEELVEDSEAVIQLLAPDSAPIAQQTPAIENRPVTNTGFEEARRFSFATRQTEAAAETDIDPRENARAAERPLPVGTTTAKTDLAANLAAEPSPNTVQQPTFATTMSAQLTSHGVAPNTQNPQTAISTPLQDKQWSQSFGDRVVWMSKNEQQTAQLSINPPQLGPIHVTLNLSGDQASAIFTSPHAEVRQAIQDAMPQLREMLSSSGISLGQANVGAQLPQQNKEAPSQFANGNRSSGETAILSPDSNSGTTQSGLIIQRGRGLVDLFA